MKLYGITNCDTVRKARKYLLDHHTEFEFHDFRATGISAEKIKSWLREVPLEKLFNKASTTWKELTDKQRESTSSKANAIRIMVKYPTIIKRPVLEDKDGHVMALGFKPEIYAELIKK